MYIESYASNGHDRWHDRKCNRNEEKKLAGFLKHLG